MSTKLTLRLEPELIEKAKAWAKERRISLSQAVAAFFAQLSEDYPSEGLSSWTRRLIGAAAVGESEPTDEEIRKDHLDHLEEKHR